jgi:hypothetical protein
MIVLATIGLHSRHCEERSDAAIQGSKRRSRIASLRSQ